MSGCAGRCGAKRPRRRRYSRHARRPGGRVIYVINHKPALFAYDAGVTWIRGWGIAMRWLMVFVLLVTVACGANDEADDDRTMDDLLDIAVERYYPDVPTSAYKDNA